MPDAPDRFYPALDEKNIALVSRISKADPGYFKDERCPYTQTVKDVFEIKAQIETRNDQSDFFDMPTTDELSQRILGLISELDAYGKSENQSSADKNTYFRLSVGLVKELVAMLEKVSLMSQHENFVNEVLVILSDICDADQRATFRSRLNKFVGDKFNEEVSSLSNEANG